MIKVSTTFLLIVILKQLVFAQEMEVIGTYQSEDTIYDMQIQGEYAYLASRDAGFEIIDISEPENPYKIAGLTDGRAILLCVEDDRAYVYFYCYAYSLEIIIYDISEPNNPYHIGDYDPESPIWDIACHDTLLLTAHLSYGLNIMNVSQAYDPYLLSNVETPEQNEGTYYIFVNSPYCYAGCGAYMWSGITQVINFSNPCEPIVELEFVTGSYGSLKVIDNIGFLATAGEFIWSFEIYDFSVPSNPVTIGQYFGYGGSVGDICISNDYAYIHSYYGNIIILDISDFSNPTYVGFYNPDWDWNCYCIDCSNEYIYLGAENNLLILRHTPTRIDEKNNVPTHTELLQNYPNPFNAQTTISFSLEHIRQSFYYLECRRFAIGDIFCPA